MIRVRLFQGHTARFDGAARQVVLPGESGEVGVLAFHAPMLCALAAGEVQIDGQRFAIRGGVARVERNHVTILSA